MARTPSGTRCVCSLQILVRSLPSPALGEAKGQAVALTAVTLVVAASCMAIRGIGQGRDQAQLVEAQAVLDAADPRAEALKETRPSVAVVVTTATEEVVDTAVAGTAIRTEAWLVPVQGEAEAALAALLGAIEEHRLEIADPLEGAVVAAGSLEVAQAGGADQLASAVAAVLATAATAASRVARAASTADGVVVLLRPSGVDRLAIVMLVDVVGPAGRVADQA